MLGILRGVGGGVRYWYALEETFVTAECDFGVVSLHIGRSYVLQVAVFAVAVANDQHLCLRAQVLAPVVGVSVCALLRLSVSMCLCDSVCFLSLMSLCASVCLF